MGARASAADRARGEVWLADLGLAPKVRPEDGFQGLLIQGQRYDIGLPDHYVERLQSFRGE